MKTLSSGDRRHGDAAVASASCSVAVMNFSLGRSRPPSRTVLRRPWHSRFPLIRKPAASLPFRRCWRRCQSAHRRAETRTGRASRPPW
ncbi:hypothetical protein F2981_02550 [Sinorhizobium meliloti]|nr:hypothetical protein [Sinorhizobium meliloti]